jgi:hypothetical protein
MGEELRLCDVAWERSESRDFGRSSARSGKRIWECRPVARAVKLPSLAAPSLSVEFNVSFFVFERTPERPPSQGI